MKSFLLSIFTFLTLSGFGQNDPNSAFFTNIFFDGWEDTFYVSLSIDTLNNSNNIWQIGTPQKTLLNQAESFPNVIITDTVNTYPTNDTSAFIIKYMTYNCPYFVGFYACDTDSLNDYGMIELSVDNGQTWMNLLADSLNVFLGNKPVLTGNSNGWQYMEADFNNISPWGLEDTLLLKFTFISDSIQTPNEGLMFDSFSFCISANTKNLYQLNNLKVFPNPTSDILNFQFETPIENAEIRIYSTIGQLMTNQKLTNNDVQFDVSNYQHGMYFYGVYVEGQLIKQGQVLIEN